MEAVNAGPRIFCTGNIKSLDFFNLLDPDSNRPDDRRQQHPLHGPHALALAVLGPERAGLEGQRPVQVSQDPPLPLPQTAGLPRPAGKNPGWAAAPAEPQEEGRAGDTPVNLYLNLYLSYPV